MIDIVCSTDTNYVMPTGVMMTSVCENNRDEEITFNVLIDDSITERQKKVLTAVVSRYRGKHVRFYVIDDNAFEAYPKIGDYSPHITKATYYRLIIEAILPQATDKVLYLDCDIINTAPLSDLWNMDLADHPIAAVSDMDESDKERYKWLGYPPELGYFNAGVLLINLKYWREHGMAAVFADFMKNHADKIRFVSTQLLFRRSNI